MHRLSKAVPYALTGAAALITFLAPAATAHAQGQGKLAAAAPVTYDNRYEIYGGINFMNFQAGQFVTERINMRGAEVLGTYWIPSNHRFLRNLGPGIDLRGDAGSGPTSPVARNVFVGNALAVLYTGMAGAQYRGPKNQLAALNYHAYGGVSHGVFDESLNTSPESVGFYTNRTKPIFALGASLDFNRSKNLAIRLQPDLILEHFGTSTREFFSVSGGLVYRFKR